MTRTYSVKFANKSKMLKTAEAVEEAKKAILDDTAAKDVIIEEDGQKVTIDADEDDFQVILNYVVNVFRKLDAKSEVSYKFGLNRN